MGKTARLGLKGLQGAKARLYLAVEMGKTARLGLKVGRIAIPGSIWLRRNGEDSPVGIESPGTWNRHIRNFCRNGEDSPVGIERSTNSTSRLMTLGRNGEDSPVGIESCRC